MPTTTLLPVMLLIAFSLALTGCGGGGGGGGGAPVNAPPVISSTSVSPRLVDLTGGKVTITGVATDSDGDALKVSAAVTNKTTSLTTTVTLVAPAGSNAFQGVFTAPANTDRSGAEVSYSVTVSVTDGNNAPVTADAGTITVQGVKAPPPPPAS